MRMRATAIFIGLLVVLTCSFASAQEAHAPSVSVTLAAGHAKLVVRRSWTNTGAEDTLSTVFSREAGSVVSRFRAAGVAGGWLNGKLLPTSQAEDAFTGKGRHGGDAALFGEMPGLPFLTLSMFPFPAGGTRTIEYTVLVPTTYADGRHSIPHPSLTGTPAPVVTQLHKAGAGRLLIDGVLASVARGQKAHFPGDALQLEATTRAPLSGALALMQLGKDRGALRYRIHAAPKLSAPPKHAHVVLLLDASRSMGSWQADGSVAAARAYLSHVPDAKVDVVVFDRHATSLFGKFVSTARAQAALSKLTLSQRNGSNVDEALTFAKDRLATVPPGVIKRAVLFTDALTKAALGPAHLGLDTVGGLLHVAVFDRDHQDGLARTDGHPWASPVATTGGVVWTAQAKPDAPLSELAVEIEELVRPIRIHHAKLTAIAAPSLESQVADTLAEGEGLTGLAICSDADPRVTLAGVLWTTPVRVTLDPSRRETQLWEGLVLNSQLADRLTDDEVRRLALRAKVASRETSFVAAIAGQRTPPDVMAGGTTGGSSCSAPLGRGGRGLLVVDAQGWLEAALEEAHRRCGGVKRTVTVALETTLDEVVEVRAQATDPALAQCMDGAAWNLALPGGFGKHRHKSFTVHIPTNPKPSAP